MLAVDGPPFYTTGYHCLRNTFSCIMWPATHWLSNRQITMRSVCQEREASGILDLERVYTTELLEVTLRHSTCWFCDVMAHVRPCGRVQLSLVAVPIWHSPYLLADVAVSCWYSCFVFGTSQLDSRPPFRRLFVVSLTPSKSVQFPSTFFRNQPSVSWLYI
jgi:hypothetical protein